MARAKRKPVLWWTLVEARRRKLGLSRAELARRAHISEATIFYGKSRGSRPSERTRQMVRLVLELEEIISAQDRAGR